uniref:Transmembrane protein 186 n=1 Tax=Cyprinus carpio TaxID=7962 RepID=A0A8C1W5H9_CYPCA
RTHLTHSSHYIHTRSLRLLLDSDGCITVALLPTVYLYLQGQTSVMLHRHSCVCCHHAVLHKPLFQTSGWHDVSGFNADRLKGVAPDFWGHRRDIYSTDVMTLGESGDTKGEPILGLKRYSRSDTLYFSSRLGRMVDKNAFEKVFGSLS